MLRTRFNVNIMGRKARLYFEFNYKLMIRATSNIEFIIRATSNVHFMKQKLDYILNLTLQHLILNL